MTTITYADRASSPVRVSPPRFFDDDAKALADMTRCAEEESRVTGDVVANV